MIGVFSLSCSLSMVVHTRIPMVRSVLNKISLLFRLMELLLQPLILQQFGNAEGPSIKQFSGFGLSLFAARSASFKVHSGWKSSGVSYKVMENLGSLVHCVPKGRRWQLLPLIWEFVRDFSNSADFSMAGVVVVKVCTFFFAAYLQIQLPSTHFIAQGVIGSIGSRFRACRLPSRILIRPEETDKSFFRK